MIYFDNAATTQMSDVAIKALIDVSENDYGNASSVYSFGRQSKDILTESRKLIAKCIGANSNEIFFTSCGTESDNWAIEQVKYGGIDSVITSKIEHHAILNPVERLEREGYKIIRLPVNQGGVVETNSLKDAINGKKQLVSIMLQNNETGIIQNIKEMAQLVYSYNNTSIFHTDAVQAVGHYDIDVKELGVDMLSASAHKFNGPKGIGFIYMREGLDISPMILGGGQENSFRSGTENVAAIYSMAKALEENVNNIEKNSRRIKYLEEQLISQLDYKGIKYTINGDRNNKAAGIVNIAFDGIDGEALLYALDMQGICVSTGSACNSEAKERSYVLAAMGVNEETIDSSIRISIGRYNTDYDIDRLADNICKYINVVSQFSKDY